MHRAEHVMGFPVFLRIDDHHVPRSAADAVFSWLRAVDERFRPFRPDSEVSRLDRGELPESEVSPDLAEVLALCEEYRPASGGASDVRLPGRGLDPCAAVKGWSVQRAAEPLSAAGARRFVLGAGGPWRVGVRRPRTPTACARSSNSPAGPRPCPPATSAATTSPTAARGVRRPDRAA